MALLAIVGNGNGDYTPVRPSWDPVQQRHLLPWEGLDEELKKYGLAGHFAVRAFQPASGTPFRAVFCATGYGLQSERLCKHEHRHPAQAAACARRRRRNPAIKATSGASITERDYPGLFQDSDRDMIPDADDPDPFTPGDESVEEVRLADEVRELIRTRQDFDHMRVQLVDRLRQVAPGAEIKSRTKTPYSILNKLRRKRLLGPKGITDLVGAMVVAHDAAELDRLVQLVQSGALGPVMEHEDLYAQPRDGYRAHHFVLLVDGKPAELQLKTKRMKAIAGAAHHAYKTGALDGRAMLELTTLADQADRGDPEAARYVDFYLSAPEQLEGLLTRRNGVRHNPPASYSDGMSLIGIDADSWAQVAEWLRHTLNPGPLYDPHGVEVRLPDGPAGDRILMAWSNDAQRAGCPDWVVADLEPMYRGPVSRDLLEQGRAHRERWGLNPPGTTVANLYTGEHRFYPLVPAEAVQAATAHDGTPFHATSVAGHVRAGPWVAREDQPTAYNPRVDPFWWQLLDTVHYAMHGRVGTKPSRGVVTITSREWIRLFPGLRLSDAPGRRAVSGVTYEAADKAWHRFLARIREEDAKGAGIQLPSEPGTLRMVAANAYDSAWRALPGQPHPMGEQWEQLLLEREERAIKAMPPGLERARARRSHQERRVASHGLYSDMATAEDEAAEYEIPGGSMDAYEAIKQAVRVARSVDYGKQRSRAELDERENKGRRPKEPRTKPPKSKKISLEEAEKLEGYDEALKAYRKFHGTDPTEVEVFYLPDGKKGQRVEPMHAALHHTIETNYVVPWESNKKDTLWIHEHPEGGEPLEVYDPRTKTTRKILRGSIVKDWWYSN